MMKIILITSLILTASSCFAALTPAPDEPVAVSDNSFAPSRVGLAGSLTSAAELPGGVATAAPADGDQAGAWTDAEATGLGAQLGSHVAAAPGALGDFRARLGDNAQGASAGIRIAGAISSAVSAARPAPGAATAPGAFTVLNVEETSLPTSRTERDDNDLRFAFHAGPAPALSLLEVAAIGALTIGALCGLAVVPRSRWHWRRWRPA